MTKPVAHAAWCLEGYVDDSRQIWRTMVSKLPFRIGRQAESDLVLPFARISQAHAQLYQRAGSLWLSDLGSTNGTFVNGQRLAEDRELHDGDRVHFADQEFHLVQLAQRADVTVTQTVSLDEGSLPSYFFDRSRELREMLREGRLRSLYQPVVRLEDESVLGYESLGRGSLAGIETSVQELFYLAEALELEVDLSAAFRTTGLELAAELPRDAAIFLNTHPKELEHSDSLVASMRRLRREHSECRIVLEIHESAVADLQAFGGLHQSLRELDVAIAFDDFGVGRHRFLELADFAPQFVKFDRTYIHNLHRAPRRRREMVVDLVRMVQKMDVATIAEGIEDRDEAEACKKLGFDYAQGYLFGRPAPAAVFA